jgi:hypothetical protein
MAVTSKFRANFGLCGLALRFRITSAKLDYVHIILLQKSFTYLKYESKHCNLDILYTSFSCLPNNFMYGIPVRLSPQL